MHAVCRRQPLTTTRCHEGFIQGKRRGKNDSRWRHPGGGGFSYGLARGGAGAVRLVVSRTTCRRPRSQGPSPFGAGVYAQPGPYAPLLGARASRSQRRSLRLLRSKSVNGRAQVGAGGGGGWGGGGGREGGGGHGSLAPLAPRDAEAASGGRD